MAELGYMAIFALVGFLVGGTPTGVIVSRQKFGIDVREIGSGNIGATNVTRAFGWRAGAIVFVIDFLKGFLPVFLAVQLAPLRPELPVVLSVSLVLGHCYSPFLKFNGGKGVATSFGCVCAVLPWAAVSAAAAYVVFLGLTKISAVGSLAGVIAMLIYTAVVAPSRPISISVVLISIVVVLRHQRNIKRLLFDPKGKGQK